MDETLSEYDKWYIILELRISAFSASTILKNYFPALVAGYDGVDHIYIFAWCITTQRENSALGQVPYINDSEQNCE